MAKYVIDSETLTGLANALRSVTGETRSYTPTEMIDAVTNIMETGTYILVDEDGNEIPAVFVENKQVFTATADDIRIGTTAVTESGVTVGTNEIPAYYLSEGHKIVPNGSRVTLSHPDWDYTKIQAVICAFNVNVANSVSTNKVVIENNVYSVSSTIHIANVTKNEDNGYIDFGIVNDSGSDQILRYFMYKEMY